MRVLLAVAGVFAAAGLAGCSHVDTSPIDGTFPAPSASSAPRSLPPPGARWSGLIAKCPKLTSTAALRLRVAGDGAPTDEYLTNTFETKADCHWGSTDGHGTAVAAQISIWKRQEATDEQWGMLSAGQTTRLDVGDEGFVTEESNAIVVRTRTGNAVATVRLLTATGAPIDQTTELRQAAAAITSDVLDDLVPA